MVLARASPLMSDIASSILRSPIPYATLSSWTALRQLTSSTLDQDSRMKSNLRPMFAMQEALEKRFKAMALAR
jgi:hypothetical protein